MVQLTLPICSCGKLAQKAGFCLPCYNRRYYDRRCFLGHREGVLKELARHAVLVEADISSSSTTDVARR